MPRISRKRPAQDDDEAPELEPQPQHRRRRRSTSAESTQRPSRSDGEGEDNGTVTEQLARKLVRYALSCEYSRRPIRREEFAKQMGTHSTKFNAVYKEANLMLQDRFGMEMVQFAMKEKVTLKERRAAQQNAGRQQNTAKYYSLASTLPDKYRTALIMPPPRVPTSEEEATYVGLYTFIVSLIYLKGGNLDEAILDRTLQRVNADQSTPLGKTDELIKRMRKDGYITYIKDVRGDEDIGSYMVGPRAKTEIGGEGVGNLVRTVYGSNTEVAGLDKRLEKSLGIGNAASAQAVLERADAAQAGKKKRRTSSRRTQGEEEPEDEGELTLGEESD
ncbi:MAGE-domain-containing protein [Tothia fuscella]|uniref:MAGE-domain-containing protein n=1 Tax=Tothia fuscella TaxID=1048955 RepID=A0A9P4NZ16_9PEZI|nr:MAGE-domain-containing protein [Tothia fuscella]